LKEGIVYLVGAGPGDPGLLTVRGLEALRAADVVVYDNLADERLLRECRDGAELIYVGKKAGRHWVEQRKINELLAEKAAEGRAVVRLKGGDPFVFGRGGEEALFLREKGIEFEVIPAPTAGIAGPAFAGIPVTHRGAASSVALVTGHEDPAKDESALDWSRLATATDTLVFYMCVKNLALITRRLMENGRGADTPAAVIQWATEPRQRTITGSLEDIASKCSDVTPPAVLVVGEVVNLRERLSWFEAKPLFGRRIVVTRAREQASELSRRLEAAGAEVIELPTIRIEPPEDTAPLDAAVRGASDFDWIVFLSANGVKYFLERCDELQVDIRELKGPRLCAMGPGTAAELEKCRLRVSCRPATYVAEELVEALAAAADLEGARVLIPRSNIGRNVVPEELRKRGAQVTEVTAYLNTPEPVSPEKLEELKARPVDVVTFTSSSTVRNFVRAVGRQALDDVFGRAVFAGIGPITNKTAAELGLKVTIEAAESTIDGLVQAIVDYYKGSRS